MLLRCGVFCGNLPDPFADQGCRNVKPGSRREMIDQLE